MTMLDRALDLLRSAPDQPRSLAELTRFAGIQQRSAGRLQAKLVDHPEVTVIKLPDGRTRYRYQPDLSIGMDVDMRKLGF